MTLPLLTLPDTVDEITVDFADTVDEITKGALFLSVGPITILIVKEDHHPNSHQHTMPDCPIRGYCMYQRQTAQSIPGHGQWITLGSAFLGKD